MECYWGVFNHLTQVGEGNNSLVKGIKLDHILELIILNQKLKLVESNKIMELVKL